MIRGFYHILLLLLIKLFTACNGAKHVPEGDALYLGPNLVSIKKKELDKKFRVEERATKRIEVWMATLKSPNGSFMGIPFIRFVPMRLYLHNWFYTEKERGFSHWMANNFGEPPLTVEKVNPAARVANAEAALFARGHFEVEGRYEIRYRRKGRKAKVHYYFEIGPAYSISGLEIKGGEGNRAIAQLLESHRQESKLKRGQTFNLRKVEEDRQALIHKLQNQGYYYLGEENIALLADTSGGDRQVKIRYQIQKNLPSYKLEPVVISDVLVVVNDKHKDSIRSYDLSIPFSNSKDNEYNYGLLNRAIRLKKGSNYSYERANRSITNLGYLNVLSGLRVNFLPGEDSSTIQATYVLQPANRFNVSIEGAVSTKTSHFAGPSLGIKLTQKNLFGGAENITYGADAFLDFPTGVFKEASSRSLGLALFSELYYPLMGTPLGLAKRSVQGLPKGLLGLKFEVNSRRDYFEILNLNAHYGLSWKTSPAVTHRLKYISFNYSNLLSTTPVFDSLLASNPQLRESFEDQFLIGPQYTYLFNNTTQSRRPYNFYLKFDLELSGNFINVAQRLIDRQQDEHRNFLGLPYAQYIWSDLDLRYYRNFGSSHKLIFRLAPGVGYAYSNSNFMPYIKQFYVGGTNSLRPVSSRSIGPGTYLPSLEEFESESFIVNNAGDVIIQGNLEYRFPILFKLKGALWADYGNVYLIEDDPQRPGAQFEWNNFARKLIGTTGIGLRLDFDYLVLRWDIGYVLYYPWFEKGQRWSWQNPLDLFGGVIALGYPF